MRGVRVSGTTPEKGTKKYPVLRFRDADNHTVVIDMSVGANRKSKPNQTPTYKYAFKGGSIGPAELGVSARKGFTTYDYDHLRFHIADNDAFKSPKLPPSGSEADNGAGTDAA